MLTGLADMFGETLLQRSTTNASHFGQVGQCHGLIQIRINIVQISLRLLGNNFISSGVLGCP